MVPRTINYSVHIEMIKKMYLHTREHKKLIHIMYT